VAFVVFVVDLVCCFSRCLLFRMLRSYLYYFYVVVCISRYHCGFGLCYGLGYGWCYGFFCVCLSCCGDVWGLIVVIVVEI
jgi:hypothetical protein